MPFNNRHQPPAEAQQYVEQIRVHDQLQRLVGLAVVKIGEVRIRGVAVWRSRNGRLRVYWPRYWDGARQEEAIDLPPELRTDVEADVIAAYKEAKKAAAAERNGRQP